MPEPAKATKESFRAELGGLIANFRANEAEYTSAGYPEAQARTDFISPFFRALGWDVENRAGLPYTKRDVTEEKGAGEGYPDYTFRIGGVPKFFVEAKPPHENLDSERHILQAKRYAWSTKEVFAVILTDFEEFRFYDASLEPDPKHPHRGELSHLRYTEYLKNIERLWEFSRERVAAGAIEALLPRDKLSLRFRKPPDEKFLEDMTRWRTELAKAVFKRNPRLDPATLTEIVQRLLDRIIFIRVAEDRRIISPRTMWERVQEWIAIGGRKPLLPMLNELFHQVKEDFNGEIFKPHDCEGIALDDWALGKIIEELYPPRGPYRFDAIPVDIFGAVYERYLGKTLRIRGKQVVPEDKLEVRKAGGVYYTPRYIVDYIVQNTVGKLIEGKTPKEIEKIKILDPACGSGSFLLGAFQCLIDYHVAYYEKHLKEAHAHPLYPELVKDGNGGHRLSIHRKARILRNNLFGVDLDPQAVEITMMNLYLKALEGERDLPQKQHLLPELGCNIRCGNSLIAPDIAQEQELSAEESERLRPFDWRSKTDGFGDILAGGGFDAVIGNPPYGADYSVAEKCYFQSRYVYKKGKPETYIFFLDRGINTLKPGGILGFITPNAWLTNYYGAQLRRFVFQHCSLQQIVDLEPTKVFQQAVVDTAITVLAKVVPSATGPLTEVWQGTKDHQIVPRFEVRQAVWQVDPEFIINVQAAPADLKLLAKIEVGGEALSDLVEYSQGVIPYKTEAEGRTNRYISPRRKGKGWLPLIESASQVRRYDLRQPRAFIRYGEWLWCAREHRFFSEPKILFHRLRKKLPRQLIGTLDESRAINRHSLSNFILRPGLPGETLRFVLGIFNSTLANWWFVKRYGLLMEVAGFKVGKLPLPRGWPQAEDDMVVLVERMLDLNKRKHSEKLAPSQLERLDRELATTDKQIDQLVYQLYGLTPEEIALVEKSLMGTGRPVGEKL